MKKKYLAVIIGAVVVMGGLVAGNLLIMNSNDDSLFGGIDSGFVDKKKDEFVDIKINMVGDLLIHNTVYQAAKSGSTYDFSHQFEDIGPTVSDADISIANLEVPLAGADVGYSNYPQFNCPEQIVDACRDTLGVDVVTTANNHSLDKGIKGLKKTLDFVEEKGISFAGTARNEEESDRVLIKDVKGVKVAILSYTYGTNGNRIPEGHNYAINLLDRGKIKQDVEKSKALGADVIVSSVHWGTEYQRNSNSEQQDLARFMVAEGVDVIMGTHPHVVQPIETIEVGEGKDARRGVVFYSLGNFISAQNKNYTDTGIIGSVNIKFNKATGDVDVNDVGYTPVFVDRNSGHPTKRYRVVDINKAITNYESKTDTLISVDEYNKMIKYRDDYNLMMKDI